ncbi:MAG TPA: hypothetical protein VMS12_07555 [Thermoanaerobaculia bacterium]|nr:hypothetical protein [Thermoanaerobaculia bacterium]
MKKKNEAQQLALEGTEEEEILGKLSQRVERAVTLIQELRKERDILKSRLNAAEEKLRNQDGHTSRLENMESEHERFQEDRMEIRSRIERILGSLESLERETTDADEV